MTAVTIVSFGYLHGPPPEADVVVDLRHRLRDPHVDPAFRELTGEDAAVRGKVMNTMGADGIAWSIADLVESLAAAGGPVTIAIGCAGGRHRSYVMAEWVAELVECETTVRHRDAHLPVKHR